MHILLRIDSILFYSLLFMIMHIYIYIHLTKPNPNKRSGIELDPRSLGLWVRKGFILKSSGLFDIVAVKPFRPSFTPLQWLTVAGLVFGLLSGTGPGPWSSKSVGLGRSFSNVQKRANARNPCSNTFLSNLWERLVPHGCQLCIETLRLSMTRLLCRPLTLQRINWPLTLQRINWTMEV